MPVKRVKLFFLFFILILLFLIAIYYLRHQGSDGRDSSLIGDGICGNLGTPEAQSSCCEQAHKGDVIVQCVGKWVYNVDDKSCSFKCGVSDNPLVCTADAMRCPDGGYVSRNASNNCQFNPCSQSNMSSN